MSASVLLEERVEIPGWIRHIGDFRRWALSDDFPETGRIDYIAGLIDVDMAPEDFLCHATPKGDVFGALHQLVRAGDLGHIVTDATRISSIPGNVSAEPDVVFVSWTSLESGQVRLTPKAGGAEGRYVELEGEPDLVVEVVSDSSVGKDTKRLPKAYFAAGVKEFWLVDAQGVDIVSQIHHRGIGGFEAAPPDADGFQQSSVFPHKFRLVRRRGRMNHWQYDLEMRL